MSRFIPILMSTPMVQAEKAGRKEKDRRTKGLEKINPKATEIVRSDSWPKQGDWVARFRIEKEEIAFEVTDIVKCPYGKVGDVLWVRETLRQKGELGIEYFADNELISENIIPDNYGPYGGEYTFRNIPNIHMPKWACRTFLQITDIRVERLQDISEEDAIAEGVQQGIFRMGPNTEKKQFQLETMSKGSPIGTHYDGFKFIWWNINGEESWNKNPWVWVITFKQISKPTNF